MECTCLCGMDGDQATDKYNSHWRTDLRPRVSIIFCHADIDGHRHIAHAYACISTHWCKHSRVYVKTSTSTHTHMLVAEFGQPIRRLPKMRERAALRTKSMRALTHMPIYVQPMYIQTDTSRIKNTPAFAYDSQNKKVKERHINHSNNLDRPAPPSLGHHHGHLCVTCVLCPVPDSD